MRYFLIGEDIRQTEITAEQAAQHRQEDDYRVIVTDDNGNAIPTTETASEPEQFPAWTPFDFGETPTGMEYTGYTITRSDPEGYTIQLDAVPDNAVKTVTPNLWKVPSTPGCYDLIKATPHYRTIQKPACGECANCIRFTCSRREKGIRCRNYKE